MALRYGYFDSEITGVDSDGMPIFDRAETSELFSLLFANLVSNGVLADPEDCFRVVADSGLQVNVQPGFGMVQGRFCYSNEALTLSISSAPQSYRRIDRVVMRCNYLDRKVEILVKSGTEGQQPILPPLIRAGDYYELCLANIELEAKQTNITQSAITDMRADSAVCGYITQLIDHLDTSVFFSQLRQFYSEFTKDCDVYYADATKILENYLSSFKTKSQTDFNAWFSNIKGQLSEDAAGNLQNQIDTLKTDSNTPVAAAKRLSTGYYIDGASFNGSKHIFHQGGCETATDIKEKTVTIPDVHLSFGSRITVRFVKGNSADNPTLNVNGTGAYPIIYKGTNIPSDYILPETVLELVYTNNREWLVVGDITQSQVDKLGVALGSALRYPSSVSLNVSNNGIWMVDPQTKALKHDSTTGASSEQYTIKNNKKGHFTLYFEGYEESCSIYFWLVNPDYPDNVASYYNLGSYYEYGNVPLIEGPTFVDMGRIQKYKMPSTNVLCMEFDITPPSTVMNSRDEFALVFNVKEENSYKNVSDDFEVRFAGRDRDFK